MKNWPALQAVALQTGVEAVSKAMKMALHQKTAAEVTKRLERDAVLEGLGLKDSSTKRPPTLFDRISA